MSIHYEFPNIKTLDDVLPYIKNNNNFIHVKKDGYSVINYTFNSNDTFPPVNSHAESILRECRGLIFDDNGKLISRRYHKFFNLGEREDLVYNFSMGHDIYEKLDGSMITPVMIKGDIRWCTKMGVTDITANVEKYIETVIPDRMYLEFSHHCFYQNFTPIFEWCSNKNRIVMNYPDDKLVLTAIRHNENGKYIDSTMCMHIGRTYNIPFNSPINITDLDIGKDRNSIYEKINNTCSEIMEGIVIRFNDGHMLKVKTEDYILQHRAKSEVENVKYAIQIIVEDKMDDYISLLSPEMKTKFEQLAEMVSLDIVCFSLNVASQLWFIRDKGISRKDYALFGIPDLDLDKGQINKSCVFKLWDCQDDIYLKAVDFAKKYIAKSFEHAKHILDSETIEVYNV